MEADYLAYPWMMAIMRWDESIPPPTSSTALARHQNAPPNSAYFSPYSSARNRFTPGIQFLIHANIKTSFEYQIRPKQIVYARCQHDANKPVPHQFRGRGIGIRLLKPGEGIPPQLIS